MRKVKLIRPATLLVASNKDKRAFIVHLKVGSVSVMENVKNGSTRFDFSCNDYRYTIVKDQIYDRPNRAASNLLTAAMKGEL